MTGQTGKSGPSDCKETPPTSPETIFPLPIRSRGSLEIFAGLLQSLKLSNDLHFHIPPAVAWTDGLMIKGADQTVYVFTMEDLKVIQTIIQTLHTDSTTHSILSGFISSVTKILEMTQKNQ